MHPLPSHGVLLELNDIGIYLIGPSGIGKSEIALELIIMGACLICDDAPEFAADTKTKQVSGHCPKDFYGLMHLHDLGIINILELFEPDFFDSKAFNSIRYKNEQLKKNSLGNGVIRQNYFRPSHSIDFIVELVPADNKTDTVAHQTPQQLLTPDYQYWQYSDWTIPGICIHLYPNRNIPLIIKIASLQFLSSGYPPEASNQ